MASGNGGTTIALGDSTAGEGNRGVVCVERAAGQSQPVFHRIRFLPSTKEDHREFGPRSTKEAGRRRRDPARQTRAARGQASRITRRGARSSARGRATRETSAATARRAHRARTQHRARAVSACYHDDESGVDAKAFESLGAGLASRPQIAPPHRFSRSRVHRSSRSPLAVLLAISYGPPPSLCPVHQRSAHD